MEKPHETLGIDPATSADEARRRYLELVRQFPPDREPERFREIHAAYQAFIDPLLQARSLVERQTTPRPWSELIEDAKQHAPRLPIDTLLGLGNPSEAAKRGAS